MNVSNNVVRHDAHASFIEPIKTVLSEVNDTQDPVHLVKNCIKHSKGTVKYLWLAIYANTKDEYDRNIELFKLENPKVRFIYIYLCIYIHTYIYDL